MQEEKVEVIIIIIIILVAKDGDADDNLYNWLPIIGNPFRCEGVGREGRVCNTFSCSGNSHVRLFLVIYNPHVGLPLVLQSVLLFDMTQLLLLGKVEYGGGPIFKVVLEC